MALNGFGDGGAPQSMKLRLLAAAHVISKQRRNERTVYEAARKDGLSLDKSQAVMVSSAIVAQRKIVGAFLGLNIATDQYDHWVVRNFSARTIERVRLLLRENEREAIYAAVTVAQQTAFYIEQMKRDGRLS